MPSLHMWLHLNPSSRYYFDANIIYCLIHNLIKFYSSLILFLFQIYFPSHQKQIEFLSNFWASHRVISSSNIQSKELSLDIQVRSLRLGALFLSKCKNIKWATTLASNNVVVPSLLVALCCPSHPVRKAALDVVQVMTKSYSIEESYHFLFTQIDGSKQEMSLDAEYVSHKNTLQE